MANKLGRSLWGMSGPLWEKFDCPKSSADFMPDGIRSYLIERLVSPFHRVISSYRRDSLRSDLWNFLWQQVKHDHGSE